MKVLKFRRVLICVIFVLFFLNGYQGKGLSSIEYTPKEIMDNGNTTIEGGRYSYDSFKVQEYLLKTRYPKESEKMVFLTFDDGPSLDNTPRVLDILKEHDVKATFFVLGVNLDKGQEYRDLIKRMFEEGHAIATHGYSHNYSYLYPGRVINYDNLAGEINKTQEMFKDILGETFNTRVVRLPGGINSWKGKSENLIRLNEAGNSVVEWNALTGDSEGVKTKEDMVLRAIETAGSSNFVVMLMHDFAGKSGRISSEALPEVIKHFKEQGFQFRTMY